MLRFIRRLPIQKSEERAKRFPDRRLGRSWYDWDGSVEAHEGDLREGPVLFLILLALVIGGATLLLAAHLWIVAHISRPTLWLVAWSLGFLAAFVVALGWAALVLCLGALSWRSPRLVFPWMPRWLTMQEPFMAFCAKPFRISRDRIGSSCIALTNLLTRLRLRVIPVRRPLLLLPRCLARECVAQIKQMAEQNQCPVVMVGTNKLAREKVREHRPDVVIAVACERDLVSGLYDFGHTMPILVLANRRPKGPCIEATVDLVQLARTLADVRAARDR